MDETESETESGEELIEKELNSVEENANILPVCLQKVLTASLPIFSETTAKGTEVINVPKETVYFGKSLYEWRSFEPSIKQRTSSHNIVMQLPGLRLEAKKLANK